MRKAFHNTIQEGPQLMIVYERDSLTDQDMVLEVLHKLKRAAWFEVQACLPWMNEDSLKRSLSDLTTGIPPILKMDMDKANMVMGPHGKRCHRYVLIINQKITHNGITTKKV